MAKLTCHVCQFTVLISLLSATAEWFLLLLEMFIGSMIIQSTLCACVFQDSNSLYMTDYEGVKENLTECNK